MEIADHVVVVEPVDHHGLGVLWLAVRCSCGMLLDECDEATPAQLWRTEQRHLSEMAARDRVEPTVHHPLPETQPPPG